MSAIGLLPDGVRRYFDFFDFKPETIADLDEVGYLLHAGTTRLLTDGGADGLAVCQALNESACGAGRRQDRPPHEPA
jgi:hypothetical protein